MNNDLDDELDDDYVEGIDPADDLPITVTPTLNLPRYLGDPVKFYALQENCWWDLFSYLNPIILDGLKQFQANYKRGGRGHYYVEGEFDDMGNPVDDTWEAAEERWDAMLESAVNAFQLIKNDEDGVYDEDYKKYSDWMERHRERWAKVDEGLQAFAKIYLKLWD